MNTRTGPVLVWLIPAGIVLTLLFSAACRSTPPATEPPMAPGGMEVAVGQEFNVTLDSNRSTGYQWQLAAPLNESMVKLVGSEYKAPESQPGLVGAGGREVWTFKAAGKGKAEISFKYVRPWEKDVAPARTQTYSVTVK